MNKIKLKNPSMQNIELLRTYYSKNAKANKQKKAFFFKANKILLISILSISIITVVVAGYVFIADKSVSHNDDIKFLFPSKNYGNITYYNYSQIKDNEEPLVLDGQNMHVAVNLREIKDLSSSIIFFRAKGQTGKERLAVILKDNYSFSNANKNDIILTGVLSKDKWSNFSVKLDNLYLPLNKNKITQLRFDISGTFTENESGATVYIKEFSIK